MKNEEAELYGEAHSYDPDFHGPIANRKCRDCLFALIFLAFLAGFVYVSFVLGIQQGDIQKITAPMDRYGFICGIENTEDNNPYVAEEHQHFIEDSNTVDLTAHKYLFFYDNSNIEHSVCVQKCPDGETDITPNYGPFTQTFSADDTYDSHPISGRCIPRDVQDFAEDFADNYFTRYMSNAMDDINQSTTLNILVGLSFVAIILGFVWLILLRMCAPIIVWVTILGILFASGFAAYYYTMAGLNGIDEAEDSDEEKSATTTRNIGYILWGVFGVLLLLVLWMRKSISLAIDVVQEAARAIAAMPILTVFPIFVFVFELLFLVYWGYSLIMLASTAEMTYADGRRTWHWKEENTHYYLLYHIFGMFWVLFFISAVSLITIAGAVAKYYFTHDKKNLGASPIWSALTRGLRYNFGSLAFGSLVIAILCFIKWILKYLSKKAKDTGNKSLSAVFKCLACCVKCAEKVMKYINKNAWIMVAIYNYSYCKAAKQGFNLIMRNLRRVLAITIVGDSLLFLGKLFIAIATGLLGTFVFYGNENYNSWHFMVALVFLISYLVGSMFMGVTEMAVDTIFLCFLEDCERNDGSAQRPYFASEALISYVNKNKKDDK
ncbi:hypothetical protein P9112_008197 [Eukaryota sp. TZLM1-RC]